jgi:hypothetical protein
MEKTGGGGGVEIEIGSGNEGGSGIDVDDVGAAGPHRPVATAD